MSKNDITGDSLISKAASQQYRDNYDKIWGKKENERSQCQCAYCRHNREIKSGQLNLCLCKETK